MHKLPRAFYNRETVLVAKELLGKNIFVDGKIVDRPSYIVPVEFENKIHLKISKNKIVKEKIMGKENE